MITRNGVVYNLKISPFIKNELGIRYFFSSKLHLNKFVAQRDANRISLEESLRKRFGFKVSLNIIADLLLYEKIETRGFYIEVEKEEYLCKEDIILSGDLLMKKSWPKRCESLMLNEQDY